MEKELIMRVEEIKIRQLTNQYLVRPADKLTVVRDLCGIQSQFMVNAMHSLRIRCNDFDEAIAADGLVKNWSLRGTVHIFAEEDLPLFVRCNNGINYLNDHFDGHTFWNQRDCWALTPERQRELSNVIITAVEHKSHTRDELKEICRIHGMTDAEEGSMFDPWGGGIRQLCERGFMNYVVQEKKAYCLSPRYIPFTDDVAKLEIARRYFTNIAPATIHDAMYFLGAKQSEVKNWLTQLPVSSIDCNGKTYYYIENGKKYDHLIPDCIFLAGFDQLMMGYQKKESLYLSEEHIHEIFNLAGIVMPAILLRGTVVGKWKKKNRKLTLTFFTRVTSEDITIIRKKAESIWTDIAKIELE